MIRPVKNLDHRSRIGFTLIELLVAIGLMAVLAGLLLPVVNMARRSASIAGMKLNFHTLVTGLEAYRQDFGSYPKNPYALIDPVAVTASPMPPGLPDAYRPCVPRNDPTLAMALLGPGPANAVGGYTNGDVDGADGPGFRTRTAVAGNAVITSASNTPTGATLNLATALSPSFTVPAPAGSQLQFSAVGIGPPGSPDAVIPVVLASGSSITLSRPLYYASSYTNQSCALLIPAGKPFDGYVKTDQFKVTYVTPTTNQPSVYSPGLSKYETQPLPVLQDNWGGPILYFPAYNAYSGRQPSTTANPTNTPTALSTGVAFPANVPPTAQTPTAPVQIGPLFGSPSLTAFSGNSPLDSNKDTIPSVFWSGSLWNLNYGQVQAILVKLGDLNANNAIDSPIVNGKVIPETFNVQTPFFLLSPGPDGIFTDLTNDSPGDWVRIVNKADDVYSFDQ